MILTELVDRLCYPTCEELKENRIQHSVIFLRNKAYCIAIFSAIIVLIFSYFFSIGLAPNTILFTLIVVSSMLLFLLATCREHPHIFPYYYAMIVSLYTILIFHYQDGYFFAFAAGFTIPVCILVLGESWKYSFLTTTTQFYLYRHYINPGLVETMMNSNVRDSVHSLITATLIFLAMLVIVVCVSNYMWMKFNEYAIEAGKLEYAYNQQNNFLLGLSHELRNPLNAMMGNIQLALLEKIDPKVKEFLEQAQLGGEILLHFINNILDSGKASIGKLEVNSDNDCNVYTLCERIWAISRRIISHKGLRGHLRIREHVPKYLKLDPYRLTQVLLNLIGNSAKFTNKGRVHVEFDWIENKINIDDSCFEPIPYEDLDEGLFEKNQTLTLLGNHLSNMLTLKDAHFKETVSSKQERVGPRRGILKITVTDTGCGIPPKNLKDIFGKFVQVNSEVIKRHVGSGLGLYITKEIINKLHGEIKVFSKVGKGTAFIFCIPCQSGNSFEISNEGNNEDSVIPSGTVKKNLRVLVVDDVAWNNQILEKYISTVEGTSVISFNGADAYEKYEESHKKGQRFDVITMDYDMPVMNGYEALKKIRQYEQDNKLRPCFAIVISGHCDQNIIRECLDPLGEVRANYFLKKPITYKQFLEVLSKV